MKLLLLLIQLLVFLIWQLTTKTQKLPAFASFKQTLYINAWSIVFCIQIIVGPIIQLPFLTRGLTSFGLVTYCFGAILAIWAKLTMGSYWGLPFQHAKTQSELVTTGPYRFSRNPIYVAELCMLLGFELTIQSWLILLFIPFLYFNCRKISFEEKLLAKRFGLSYRVYRNKTPRFL